MQRILEPEVMDTLKEALEYDAMDFREVNMAFAQRVLEIAPNLPNLKVLDAGTGTARIPILIGQQRSDWKIIGIDLAKSMLDIGRYHIEQARLHHQISLEEVDAKQMPYPDYAFDLVISNSLIHHLPEPLLFLRELKRVLKPHGGIFLRDLLRPPNEEILTQIVVEIGSDYSQHQSQLFADSLRAAFTLEEIEDLIGQAGLEGVKVYQSSDRHWTAEK